MWPVVTDGLHMCLLVTAVSGAKTDELIEMPFGYGLGWAQGTMYYFGAQILTVEGSTLGDVSQPIVKYGEYPGRGRYSQPYSIGGSSDAASGCK